MFFCGTSVPKPFQLILFSIMTSEYTPKIPSFEANPAYSFSIQVCTDLSLADMQALTDQGESMERSAHIGNQYPSNQVLADAGIYTTHFDRTEPARDKNYHPGSHIAAGISRIIIPLGQEKMLTRGLQTVDGTDLFAYHAAALRQAYPHAKIVKYSELIQTNSELIHRIIAAMEFDPQLWLRRVGTQGTIEQHSPKNASELLKNLLDVTDHTQGYIFAAEINAIVLGIVDYLNTHNHQKAPATDQIYHISGPDMIKYFPQPANQAKLSKIYREIRKNDPYFYAKLPETLHFVLLPSYHLRLAVPQQYQKQLDQLLDAKDQLAHLRTAKAHAMKNPTETDRATLIEDYTFQQKILQEQEANALMSLAPQLFSHLAQGAHYTHHDAAESGERLYIPDYTRHTPASEIEKYLHHLEKQYRKNTAK
jgi:hypothetical protein